MSLHLGIDTLSKWAPGSTSSRLLLTNAAFTSGRWCFEVPTGVVADTVGRRVSLLLCLVTLFVTTLLYVASPGGEGDSGVHVGLVFLGLGYTFYTGAVDAWLVDALKASGYNEPLERVFSGGRCCSGRDARGRSAAACWQIRLDIPYLVRAPSLCALLAGVVSHAGARLHSTALELRRVPAELRRVFVEGLSYGVRNPVIGP